MFLFNHPKCYAEGNLSDVELHVLDYDIVINEFELQSRYYVHFGLKGYEPTSISRYDFFYNFIVKRVQKNFGIQVLQFFLHS